MSTAEGRSSPRLNDAADTKKLRRYFIGGSDARIIMGADEAALIRLWREKRGEVEPEDLSCRKRRAPSPVWGRAAKAAH